MLKDGRKLILKPWGGCGDSNMGAMAFAELGYESVYSPSAQLVDFADLIILPGGADIDFRRYDGNPKLCGMPSPSLEIFDRDALPIALERQIPIFGICRGHQSLWAELGGKLEEHITPRHTRIRRAYGHIVKGTWGETLVNSLHHQAPKYPAPDGVSVQMHAPDGTIEAFTYSNFAVSVQWHPEMMLTSKWLHLIIAAIRKEVDRIPELYPLKALPDADQDIIW